MKLILLLILLTPLFLFAQGDITITEGSDIEICGRTLRIDGIWIANGRIKADISVLWEKNSKPITGSYNNEDTILIGKCIYQIFGISKYGIGNKGEVFISQTHGSNIIGDYMDKFYFYLNETYTWGYEDLTVEKIWKDSAEIKAVRKDLTFKTITLKKNDILWSGRQALYVSDIFFDPSFDLQHQWQIELKQVKDYFYLNGPGIPGELINGPPNLPRGETELIIRKMKYYPKKKVDEGKLKNTPVKYWVLKVIYYHGGMVRPVIEVERSGKKMFLEYDAYKSFDSEEDVLEFAKVNGITDIILSE